MIAYLPIEITDKVLAVIVATDMLRSFLFIRFGLVIGIGDSISCHNNLEQVIAVRKRWLFRKVATTRNLDSI